MTDDAKLIERLREGVAARGDGTYKVAEAEEVMDLAADHLTSLSAERQNYRQQCIRLEGVVDSTVARAAVAEAKLALVTSPEYLATALEKIGVCDIARAEAAEAKLKKLQDEYSDLQITNRDLKEHIRNIRDQERVDW